MRMIEEKIKLKITSLEKLIDFRDNDRFWLNSVREGKQPDMNEYFWRHCGERDFYQGKLEQLKELIE